MNATLYFSQILIYVGAGLGILFTLLGFGLALGIIPGRVNFASASLHDTYYLKLPFWLYLFPVLGAVLIFGTGLFMRKAHHEGVSAVEEWVAKGSPIDGNDSP